MENVQEEATKWEGKVSAILKVSKADQVWLLWEDFLAIDKWFPSVQTCKKVGGVAGQPGCVRYVIGILNDQQVWAKERLLTTDRKERCFTYEVMDGNIGLDSYLGTIKVLAEDGDQNGGCRIEWSIVVKPKEGWWKKEDLFAFFDSTLQSAAQRMEEALKPET